MLDILPKFVKMIGNVSITLREIFGNLGNLSKIFGRFSLWNITEIEVRLQSIVRISV